MNLQTLINKRFDVPETKTKRFPPTLAEKKENLKKNLDYSIPRRKPSLAVGDNGTQQKSPES